jgi:RHS repeat-associated protein
MEAADVTRSVFGETRICNFLANIAKMIFLLVLVFWSFHSCQAHAQCPGVGSTHINLGPFNFPGFAGSSYTIKYTTGNPYYAPGSKAKLITSTGAVFDTKLQPGCSGFKTSALGYHTQIASEKYSKDIDVGYGGAMDVFIEGPVASPKNLGPCDPVRTPNTCEGNPFYPSTGNKYQIETDFVGGPNTQIELRRHYNSLAIFATAFGQNWRSTYDRSVLSLGDTYTQVVAQEGRVDSFWLKNGVWTPDPDVRTTLSSVIDGGSQAGWKVVQPNDTVEYYNMTGQLTSIVTRSGLTTTLAYNGSSQLTTVSGPFGHTLTFTYNSNGNVYQVTTPNGGIYTYAYDSNNNLISVTYPDNTTRQYAYTNTSFKNALTGITDENSNVYATYVYDTSGRATSSQHAGGADLTTVSYSSNFFGINGATVTDPRNNTHTYAFTTQFGVVKPTSLTGTPSQTVGGKAFSYDSNGFVLSKTDYNNSVTRYTYDSRGNETSRIEAYGSTVARTISTTWHSTFHLPTQITEPNRTTTFTYDSNGNMLTKTIAAGSATRTWTYTYNVNGQVLTAQDPNSNTTTYTYDGAGNLATVTDPLSHVTNYTSCDANGRLLSVTDPNGLVTTFIYDARGRLLTSTVGTEATTYTYDNAGNLTRVTRPDSSYIAYSYDNAHRLIGATDTLGNYMTYTLDAASNITAKRVYDPSATQRWTRTYTYDSANRLATEVGASSQTTTYAYDSNSNLTSVTDPLNHVTAYVYDALNRKKQVTNPNSGVTQYGFDANDHVTSVTDPRNLVTSYTYNGLDNQTAVSSPDTGSTSKTYDSAGNVLTSTDARGNTTTYTYDALNRLTGATYADSTTASWTYDQGTYGIGHLTSMTDTTGTTAWTYDIKGRTTQKQQVTGSVTLTTGYSYDSYGRLSGITYPSGKSVAFAYDANGRANAITSGGVNLVSNVTYIPFGAVTGWTEGNGAGYSRTFDQDGLIAGITIGGTTGVPATTTLTYTPDAAARITALTETGMPNKTFGYDNLDRLTSLVNGSATTSYAYDADGNRTSATVSGATTTYGYPSGNNKLSSLSGQNSATYTYDASGNMTSDGTYAWGYDARGRMASHTAGSTTTTYGVNALGQRVAKTGAAVPPSGVNVYAYSNAGRLLGEYDGNGNTIMEYVWLGDLPIAALSATAVYQVSPDNLGAPHIITDQTGNQVWTWDHLAFGDNAPNQNPSGLGVFNCNLRFPGQYYDAEDGLHYNYFRDYNPAIGRYVQSDPIGLLGGVNTYAYVDNRPINSIDPLGLETMMIPGLLPLPPLMPQTPQQQKANYELTKSLIEQLKSRYNPDNWIVKGLDLLKMAIFPPGFWPADKGSDEWGRKNKVDKTESRNRFHKIKDDCKGKPKDEYAVNPDSGDVVNPEGEIVGNLGEE